MTPNCPQCGKPLEEVRYPSESMLNRDQWESMSAGDWYCESCPYNGRAKNPKGAYFWNSEVTGEKPEANCGKHGGINQYCSICLAECAMAEINISRGIREDASRNGELLQRALAIIRNAWEQRGGRLSGEDLLIFTESGVGERVSPSTPQPVSPQAGPLLVDALQWTLNTLKMSLMGASLRNADEVISYAENALSGATHPSTAGLEREAREFLADWVVGRPLIRHWSEQDLVNLLAAFVREREKR